MQTILVVLVVLGVIAGCIYIMKNPQKVEESVDTAVSDLVNVKNDVNSSVSSVEDKVKSAVDLGQADVKSAETALNQDLQKL